MITTKQSNQYLGLLATQVLQDRALTPRAETRALEALQTLEGKALTLEQQAHLRECVDPWRETRDTVQQQRLAQTFLDYLAASAGVSGTEYQRRLGEGLTRALDCACGVKTPVELPVRCEPLPPLTCTAYAGVFEDPRVTHRPDPLVLIFGSVEKSTPSEPTVLWLRNRSNLHDSKPVRLPGNTTKAADGNYHLMFDDAQMRALGVRPGDVIEVHQSKGERSSKPVQVRINDGGPSTRPTPQLPPGDTVGSVDVKQVLRTLDDRHVACVRPEQLEVCFDDGQAKVSSKGLALEPFARVQLTNLATGEKSAVVVVDGDGQFDARVAAKHGEPIMISAGDHSSGLDRSPYVRRLTFNAGDGRAILALNPRQAGSALAPVVPELNTGRIQLAAACQTLEIDAGVTPGSIVTLTRSGHADQTVTAVADERGSVSLRLPFTPHAADVIELSAANPYHDKSLDWGQHDPLREHAKSAVTLELQKDGSLVALEPSGQACTSAQAVRPTDNLDHINDVRDVRSEIRGRIGALTLTSHSYYPRTASGGTFAIDVPRPGVLTSHIDMDAKTGELVVIVGSKQGAVSSQMGVGWGGGDSGMTGVAGAAERAVGPNGQLPVRFQTEDGQIVARGHLCATIKPLHDRHRITTLELDRGSLVYV